MKIISGVIWRPSVRKVTGGILDGMRANPPLAATVASELRHLAQRHIARSFGPVGSTGPIEIGQLCELAATWFPARWAEDREGAVAAVIQRGASRLEGAFGRMAKKRAALVLFDLEGGNELQHWKQLNLEGRYSELLGQIRKESGLKDSASNFRRKIRSLRMNLAYAVTDIDSDAGVGASREWVISAHELADPGQSIQGLGSITYIRRPEYHDGFKAALRAGRKIVVLVGPPGTGKERLATEIVAEYTAETSTKPDVFRGGPLQEFACELAAKLGDYGVATAGMTDEQLFRAFIDHLRSDRAPACTLILELREVELLAQISLRQPTTMLVVVSNCVVPQMRGIERLQVAPLDTATACSVASQFLPDVPDGEIARLVETVGGSPQALEKAAHFVLRPWSKLSVAGFCRSFPRNAALILRTTSSDLVDGYSRTLEALRKDHPDAADVLEHLAFLADLVPVELLVQVLAEKHGGHRDDTAVYHGVVMCALDILKEHALISHGDMTVRLYSLARAIGKDLLRSARGDEVAGQLRSVILDGIRRRAGSTCRSQSINQLMSSARSLINQLFHLECRAAAASGDEKEAGREVAKAIRKLRGNFAEGALVSVVPMLEGQLSVYRLTLRLDGSSQRSRIRIRRAAISNSIELKPSE